MIAFFYLTFSVFTLIIELDMSCLVDKKLGDSGLSIDAARVIFWGSIHYKENVGLLQSI